MTEDSAVELNTLTLEVGPVGASGETAARSIALAGEVLRERAWVVGARAKNPRRRGAAVVLRMTPHAFAQLAMAVSQVDEAVFGRRMRPW